MPDRFRKLNPRTALLLGARCTHRAQDVTTPEYAEVRPVILTATRMASGADVSASEASKGKGRIRKLAYSPSATPTTQKRLMSAFHLADAMVTVCDFYASQAKQTRKKRKKLECEKKLTNFYDRIDKAANDALEANQRDRLLLLKAMESDFRALVHWESTATSLDDGVSLDVLGGLFPSKSQCSFAAPTNVEERQLLASIGAFVEPLITQIPEERTEELPKHDVERLHRTVERRLLASDIISVLPSGVLAGVIAMYVNKQFAFGHTSSFAFLSVLAAYSATLVASTLIVAGTLRPE